MTLAIYTAEPVLDLVAGAIAVILVAIDVSLHDHFQAASIGVVLNIVLTLYQFLVRSTQNTPSGDEGENACPFSMLKEVILGREGI
ncbi:hypothetical protein BDV18DRAFT_135614 [Aspergillus unguis]